MSRIDRRTLLGLPLLAVPAGRVGAQSGNYPERTVTIVLPFATGGPVDALARIISARLQQRFDKPFVIESRPGGSSVNGIHFVTRSEPDGYTILFATTAIAANVTLLKSLPYDPVTDLAPIALVVRLPLALVVNADLPIRSLSELIEYAKSKPDGLTYASPGFGTSQHICGELLKFHLGINLMHLPYRGVSQAIHDVAGGHVALMCNDILTSIPLVQAGKLRMLGVSVPQRVAAIPDVPPLADIGIPEFDLSAFFIFMAPAKTPKEIIDKLHAAIREIMDESELKREIGSRGIIPVYSPSPEKLEQFIKSEISHWGEIIKKIGLAGSL
jgi:tripartite-type tricarboxylate transporter receptor subunit TctC